MEAERKIPKRIYKYRGFSNLTLDIQTWQGWLYLAVVVDLYARRVVGWSMSASLSRELVLDALLMAVWRRKPDRRVVVHSDQGSQYGSRG